jgi:cyclophilin family peptidyl-prolyl cis-trans isomerase
MERQLAAGLCVRGWLETSYYQLGADPGLSYMAAMGGSGILDYALNFSGHPTDWLQLGYASYLSSWCLVNCGPPENNYGFWFPGRENDGAAGWQFMSAKAGSAWMGSSYPGGVTEPRGPWHYDGEIDLGFGGALRMAATILTRDPVFDWVAYGGTITVEKSKVEIVPRDGLRQRFDAVINDQKNPESSTQRLKMELDRDGFVAGKAIATDSSLRKIVFALENRTDDEHVTGLWLSLPSDSSYSVLQDGNKVVLTPTGNWDYPLLAGLKVSQRPSTIEVIREGPELNRRAPDLFDIQLETSKGIIMIEVHRDWAPHGADRFYNLVSAGYYDDDRFFRVIQGRWAQFGINGDPKISNAWRTQIIPDDERRESNVRGTVAFAFAVTNGRTTEIFINLKDNSATHDPEAFVPFGKVIAGMDIADALNTEYGETAGGGIRAGKQEPLFQMGNEYLERQFPRLDYILHATVVQPTGANK